MIIKVTADMDETDYLTLDPANEKHLLENKTAEPSIIFKGDEFQEFVNKKLK